MSGVVLPPLVQRKSPNESSRHGARIDYLVLHETAGSYQGSVAWLCNPVSEASAHLVLREDAGECTQLVRRERKAWTQGNWNPRCLSLELATTSPKGYANEAQLHVAARIFGWLCLEHAIPPRWARAGSGRGLVFHGNLPDSGGHPFCGPTMEAWQRFVVMVGAEIERGGYRKVWAL